MRSGECVCYVGMCIMLLSFMPVVFLLLLCNHTPSEMTCYVVYC